ERRERLGSIKLSGPPGADRETAPGGLVDRPVDQPGLADAGLPGEHQATAGSVARRGEGCGDISEFAVPAHQGHRRAARAGHAHLLASVQAASSRYAVTATKDATTPCDRARRE